MLYLQNKRNYLERCIILNTYSLVNFKTNTSLIPQRLTRLQHTLYPFQCFSFTAKA